ncbi:MAG: hypothetical protein ACOVQQ_10965 [Flavobacterium sp.]
MDVFDDKSRTDCCAQFWVEVGNPLAIEAAAPIVGGVGGSG